MFALEADSANVIEVDGVHKNFSVARRRGWGIEHKQLRAVSNVSLKIGDGESFGIVGESGSGKSTLARLIFGLEKPSSGRILYGTNDVTQLSDKGLLDYWREVQIIFQDPFSSLNPRMKIGRALAEPLRNYRDLPPAAVSERVAELLDLVGLPKNTVQRYPHELSGGQRQRVAIAAALAVNPRVVIADEAVSALDVSVQAQIINLLSDLRARLGLTYLFITHDLNLCAYFCDRIAVMYLGQVMEVCAADELLSDPLHPYTQALISAIPSLDPSTRRQRTVLRGEIPSPLDPPAGCPFAPRCWRAVDVCREKRPVLQELGTSMRGVGTSMGELGTPTLQGMGTPRQVACHVVANEFQTREMLNEQSA